MQYQGVEARVPTWKARPSIPQLAYGEGESTARACGQQSRLPAFPLLLPAFFNGSALSSSQRASLHLLLLQGLCLWCRLHPSRKPFRTPHTQGWDSFLLEALQRSSFGDHLHCHLVRQLNQVSVSLSQLCLKFAKTVNKHTEFIKSDQNN